MFLIVTGMKFNEIIKAINDDIKHRKIPNIYEAKEFQDSPPPREFNTVHLGGNC